ncbi:3'-5' exoribonuclease [Fictibacillus sp. 7GRE50]|uniref:exonuclease domain-containing protein n=2 Tax=unclassified Fictibacillus TaxID=2644029 RepID=UPI0018CF9435|nr:exonuclease domain-containing protein [Fictibacillus sp. 23RED33]MBH0164981.1 3'-5' exoribonuclease [Fictibacillus sp. 7GRE50]MBH0172422.1 3'-5' exoribonuclease [Fictibacillus sp. 23RED33]
MRMNPLIQFMKQVQGKINSSVYASLQGQSSPQHVAFLRQLEKELKMEESLTVPLNDLNVVVFDLETTGFFPEQGNQILSIGAVKVKGGEVRREETFYSLTHCKGQLSHEIKELTGIEESELENAPQLSKVLVDFYDFARGHVLVAHHASHEKKFLQHYNWKLFRSQFKHRIVDTSFLLKIAEPNVNLVTLEDCCKHCNVPVIDRHHALGDAKMTAELWSVYVARVQKLGIKNLREVYERLSR